MVEVPLDGLHVVAQSRANAVPELRRSMRGAAGNEVGAMGELVAMRYLEQANVLFRDEPDYDHDIWTPHGTIDVKSKERTVSPQPHYDCTVPEYVEDAQKPDWYLFVSLLSDKSRGCHRFKRGWVLGSISYAEFWERARVVGQGDLDESNGWAATIACRNLPVSALRPPVNIVE
jgi:hypothetical protein